MSTSIEMVAEEQIKVLLRYLCAEVQNAINALTENDSFENWESCGYAILWDECEKLREEERKV